ncbi:hypothetical protein V1477_017380 [Vespula maculifrons]|uniref:Uncharacterized protein n=1 Tax=Vespula maculifrons TaxID=7453 RepID=A0ABD2B5V4_VESMC
MDEKIAKELDRIIRKEVMVGLAGKRGDISDEPARGNAFNRRNGREPATKYDLALSFLSDTTRIRWIKSSLGSFNNAKKKEKKKKKKEMITCLTAADAAAAAAATGAASAVTAVVAAAATVAAAAAAAAVGGFAIGNWRRQSEKTPLELMRRSTKTIILFIFMQSVRAQKFSKYFCGF